MMHQHFMGLLQETHDGSRKTSSRRDLTAWPANASARKSALLIRAPWCMLPPMNRIQRSLSSPVLLLSVVLALALSSCVTSLSKNTPPGNSLRGRQAFHVQREPGDTHGLHEVIAREIRQRHRLAASTGEPGTVARTADTVVLYRAGWSDAEPTHLQTLEIAMVDAATRRPITRSRASRAGIARTSPESMARETLGILFGTVRPDLATEAASRQLPLHINTMTR